MHVELPAEQQAIIESLVASGRFASLSDALCTAIDLLISREELCQRVQVGIEQADRGELADHDTVFSQLRLMASAAEQSERGR